MSKLELLNQIKNPDIPGLEVQSSLPPPPPLLLPSLCNNAFSKDSSNENSNINDVIYTSPMQNNYCIAQPEHSTDSSQPWWIPTDADSIEIYSQWYKSAYKATFQVSQEKDFNGKTKVKYFKRKQVIDPKTDAERVANAQKELSVLMKPLKCDLCNAVMNSTLQAKLHYQGKPHQKKVSMFLNQSAKKCKIEEWMVSSTTTDWNTYCEICKIWFTSQTDAIQHYAGKKHMKAAYGTKSIVSKKIQVYDKSLVDSSNGFGIDIDFQSKIQIPQQLLPFSPKTISSSSSNNQLSNISILRCELCGISANRQDQLDNHKKGTKHLKMLKINGIPINIIESVSLTTGFVDYSIYRTPSGQYYCSPCNLSLDTEITFAKHMESKKHRNQINLKQQMSQPSIQKTLKK